MLDHITYVIPSIYNMPYLLDYIYENIIVLEEYCKRLEGNVKDLKDVVYSILNENMKLKQKGISKDISDKGVSAAVGNNQQLKPFVKRRTDNDGFIDKDSTMYKDSIKDKDKDSIENKDSIKNKDGVFMHKPFVCDICGHKFGYPQTLKYHKIHNCSGS